MKTKVTTSRQQRTLRGVVVSAKLPKTRIVAVTRTWIHPKYGRRVKVTSRFATHDEHNRTQEGDQVVIVESRPLSKTKRWRIANEEAL